MSTAALVARGLTVAAPGGVLVRSAALRLGRARCLGIIGESGSGKTLTLRSLMGLLPDGLTLTEGRLEVDLDGRASRPVDDPRLLRGRGLSMVFQDPLASLDPTMRVGTFVAEVLRRNGTTGRRAARARVADLFTEVGFTEPGRIASSFPHQLSNGQRQRVVLAIALASDPSVLLCDEATSALDVTTQAQIVDLLNDLRARRELSIVFVTHDLAVARQTVDDVVVMFAGRVVEVGDIDTVLNRPRHPYTRALIEAYSTGRGDATAGLPLRQAEAADPGCPYRWRCRQAVEGCAAPLPVLDAAEVRVGSTCILDEQDRRRWGAA
jgi:oligopeptide/dipeptide ABC transporter ATP-binding protein